MRLLVISNLFPPHVLGGYEILCAQVCEELARRGHRITVLTSDHGVTGQERDDPYPVHRRLQIYQPFGETGRLLRGRRLQVGRRSHRITRELIASERPEQIFVWSLLRLTLGPARAALESSIPTAFTFNDENIAGYLPVPFAPTPRRLLGWLADRVAIPQITLRGLQLSRSTCISAQLKSKLVAAGVPVDSSRVIYQGIPIERFPLKSPRPFSRPAKVLFTGQLVPMKGIPTLIEAAHRIARDEPQAIELAIAGAGYLEPQLRAQAADGPASIRFLGKVPHEQMPALYREHDLFAFPSTGAEPFGLTYLEAMASGLPVVSTATGGHGEVVRDGENALVFAPGDAEKLASNILRIIREPLLAARLAETARAQVERKFTVDRYVTQLEEFLQGRPPPGPQR